MGAHQRSNVDRLQSELESTRTHVNGRKLQESAYKMLDIRLRLIRFYELLEKSLMMWITVAMLLIIPTLFSFDQLNIAKYLLSACGGLKVLHSIVRRIRQKDIKTFEHSIASYKDLFSLTPYIPD